MPSPAHPQLLQRTVRFSVNPDGSTRGSNSYAGKPANAGLGRYYEITLGVRGIPDPDTGYLVGIHDLDAVVREKLLPAIATRCQQDPATEPGAMLPELWEIAQSGVGHRLERVVWALSPYDQVEMNTATHDTRSVLMRQRFEFAAAHRLHTPTLSDEQNAEFFGKCNNPHGHGHNYRIEPCVSAPVDSLEKLNIRVQTQQLVNTVLLDVLDHKFLNIECDWFNQDKGGVIPSVENIARVCYEQLAPAIAALGHGVTLANMTAWETDKTSSVYPAPSPTAPRPVPALHP